MLNCFGAAKFTQIKANDKVEAGNKVQSVAEMIKSFDTSIEADEYLTEHFKLLKTDGKEKKYVNYYDKYWNLCTDGDEEENTEYFITVKTSDVFTDSGELREFVITLEKIKPYPFISTNEKSCNLYEVETKKFFSTAGR